MQRYHLTDEFTDIPAEQALLASLAQAPALYWDLVDLLTPEVFTKEIDTWQAITLALGGCPRITLNASWGYVESCESWVKPGAVSTWEGKRTPHTDPDGSRRAIVHPYDPAHLD